MVIKVAQMISYSQFTSKASFYSVATTTHRRCCMQKILMQMFRFKLPRLFEEKKFGHGLYDGGTASESLATTTHRVLGSD